MSLREITFLGERRVVYMSDEYYYKHLHRECIYELMRQHREREREQERQIDRQRHRHRMCMLELMRLHHGREHKQQELDWKLECYKIKHKVSTSWLPYEFKMREKRIAEQWEATKRTIEERANPSMIKRAYAFVNNVPLCVNARLSTHRVFTKEAVSYAKKNN